MTGIQIRVSQSASDPGNFALEQVNNDGSVTLLVYLGFELSDSIDEAFAESVVDVIANVLGRKLADDLVDELERKRLNRKAKLEAERILVKLQGKGEE